MAAGALGVRRPGAPEGDVHSERVGGARGRAAYIGAQPSCLRSRDLDTIRVRAKILKMCIMHLPSLR